MPVTFEAARRVIRTPEAHDTGLHCEYTALRPDWLFFGAQIITRLTCKANAVNVCVCEREREREKKERRDGRAEHAPVAALWLSPAAV